MTIRTKEERKVIDVVCRCFELPRERYLVGINGKGTPLLVNKWIVFFIHRYSGKTFEYVGSVIPINEKDCMDYIGDIGFNIRAHEEYEINFNEMNPEILKIYKDASS